MKQFQLNFIISKSTIRWLKILNELEMNPISNSTILSEVAGTTRRTIGTDIQ